MQNKRRARTVSFLPSVRIRQTIRINDYTDDEIASAWYDETELDTVISDIKTTLLLIEEEGVAAANSDPERCTRGLESYTPEGQRLKERSRMKAKDAVLDEQEFQDETGIFDPELLADLYYERTRWSEARARVMGRSDEEAVRQGDKMQALFPTNEVPGEKAISSSVSFFLGDDTGAANRRGGATTKNSSSGGLRKLYSKAAWLTTTIAIAPKPLPLYFFNTSIEFSLKNF